ncbi:hypothetical protein CHARACLAT_028259 [Characodon lateralis]|uniref:Uncharacterized protein n=1 Tax=Characodon lateralis TaxID=208331 RepID=A0ABU7DME5_9TELE|nr:hypothetical protein [Characodon lateralis]
MDHVLKKPSKRVLQVVSSSAEGLLQAKPMTELLKRNHDDGPEQHTYYCRLLQILIQHTRPHPPYNQLYRNIIQTFIEENRRHDSTFSDSIRYRKVLKCGVGGRTKVQGRRSQEPDN